MLTFATIVHVLLCVFMIFVILLQPGKDAGMGSALGGGAATSAFGGRGAVTFLSKVTGACALLFFITSLGLSFVGMRTSVATAPAPRAPAAAPAQLEQLPAGEAPVGAQPEAEGTVTPPNVVPGETTPTPASGMPVSPEGAPAQ